MVKRRATRGEMIGMEFWGCSRFPHCHGIINI
jgi:ssDNA-binding Zn-finger/Zn-ribbon topoisomerase 1